MLACARVRRVACLIQRENFIEIINIVEDTFMNDQAIVETIDEYVNIYCAEESKRKKSKATFQSEFSLNLYYSG